jgi:hypothetical protein
LRGWWKNLNDLRLCRSADRIAVDALAALRGDILDTSMLIPNGACLQWKPELIWLNAVSDAMVAGAFFTTAFVLGSYVWRRRREVMFRGVSGPLRSSPRPAG